MKLLDDLKKNDLVGKKVLLRVDFDAPLVRLTAYGLQFTATGSQLPATGSQLIAPNHQLPTIAESYRIRAHKETIDYLVAAGARVMLASHISAIRSFAPLVEQIGQTIDQTITMVLLSELAAVKTLFSDCPVLLLDNIRQDQREEKNDAGFAAELAAGFDLYVNDAFAVSHRNHASVVAVTKHLPSYAGLLMKKEIDNLSSAIETPAAGKVLVMGGAKISTKEPVIRNFLDRAEKILVGGAVANDFFQAQGVNVGRSVVDNSVAPDFASSKIILPDDVLVSSDISGKSGGQSRPVGDLDPGESIVDIGPESAKKFAEIISQAAMVVWNGPLGLVEIDAFAKGTRIIAEAVAAAPRSVIGGGDTIAAVDRLGLLDKYSFVSTGGGAMLEFLAGQKMPGLEALGYY